VKFFLMRHAEAEKGEPLDPTRGLTDTGKLQIPIMAKFLKTQTADVGLVMCSDMHRGIDTAEGMAEYLKVDVLRHPELGPDGKPEKAFKIILKQAQKMPDKELLVVSHGKLINLLAAWLLESGEKDKFHFSHGTIALFDTDEPKNYGPYAGKGGQPAFMHWMVTAKMVNRLKEKDPASVVERAKSTPEQIAKRVHLREAADGSEKSWIGGTCPVCQENSDAGWIPVDEQFPSGDDEPPAHPNCDCDIETRDAAAESYDAGVVEGLLEVIEDLVGNG